MVFKKHYHYIIIAITAVVAITICSKASPLYPFNDWVDSNCFLTVGKAMLHGQVPYRDLFEQKGPLLYMLHALAALISDTSFLGVYFVEIAACAAFLFFSYKIMWLFQPKASIYLVPVLAAIVYTTFSFSHGDSAEELCLPFLAFACYIELRAIHTKQALSSLNYLAIGITSACVLWIKFSLVGFYIGWFIVPAILLLREKKWKELFRNILIILLGILLASLPIILYFICNHSLSYLWEVYFYNNVFFYQAASEGTWLSSHALNLWMGLKSLSTFNFYPTIITLLGMMALPMLKSRAYLCSVFSSWLTTFLFIYIGGRGYAYYAFILNAFAAVGVVMCFTLIRSVLRITIAKYVQISQQMAKFLRRMVFVASAVYMLLASPNVYLLAYDKSELPQYEFAEIMSQVENPTLLNYCFLDGGFYTVADILPNCRYFCTLNIPLQELYDEQNSYIWGAKTDFIITRDYPLYPTPFYTCVRCSSFYFAGSVRDYYLYQRTSLPN